MASDIVINAEKREITGRKVEQLRKEGKTPAVVYGAEVESTNIVVDTKEFLKTYEKAGESTIVDLKIEGEKESHPVIIKDLDINYVARKLLHVSFYSISMKEEMDAEIPLVLVGVAPVVKDLGATIVQNMSEVTVRCLPKDLPHQIEIDISGLVEFGDNISLADIKLPEGVVMMKEEDEMSQSVVFAAAPLTEEQEKALEEENAAPLEEVETTEQGEVEEGTEGVSEESAE